MLEFTGRQKAVLAQEGHLLVTGGPGSGKTTVSILKAARLAKQALRPEQKVLFLSFARATVSRVIEAIDGEAGVSTDVKRQIEVDTYHSFFWRLIKAHGYLLGLPRRLDVLAPAAEAVALSAIRAEYKAEAQLTDAERAEKAQKEAEERERLAFDEGRVCFDLFAPIVGRILHGSNRLRRLAATAYPFIILDEFQDTNSEQWHVVQALGTYGTLIALADPEQRIFDWIGADPARLDHFRHAFSPAEFDLSTDNHRSRGTEIAHFGNDVLAGAFSKESYNGIHLVGFESNQNQALACLKGHTLQARRRLLDSGRPDWSLAILVPTKRMTRLVSDAFRQAQATPAIQHTAAVDVESAILAAEIVAFFMEPDAEIVRFPELVQLLCFYFQGKGGDAPSQTSLKEAARIQAAFERALLNRTNGKPPPANSVVLPTMDVYQQVKAHVLKGDPDADWTAIRAILETGACKRLKEIGTEVRNVRLLDRGTQLRQALAEDWRSFGEYRNALQITRNAFIQDHFVTAHKAESEVVVMNMHKAKGKQFDEVIIFEGWPNFSNGKIVANSNRIARGNDADQDLGQARQNFRVSITRAKMRTTILTPRVDPCVLLGSRSATNPT